MNDMTGLVRMPNTREREQVGIGLAAAIGCYTAKRTSFVLLPSGLAVPADAAERRPIGVDLFAGAGGFSLGFIQAGFEIVAALDSDPMCAETYMTNLGTYPCQFHFVTPEDREAMEALLSRCGGHPAHQGEQVAVPPVAGTGWIAGHPEARGVPHFFLGDARKVRGEDILRAVGLERGEIDCVFGGPPCQGFTTAGKRDIMDPRNSLVFEFARLVLELWPRALVMENVPGILSMLTPERMPVMDVFTLILEQGGFGLADAIKGSLLGMKGRGFVRRRPAAGSKADAEKTKLPTAEPTLFDADT